MWTRRVAWLVALWAASVVFIFTIEAHSWPASRVPAAVTLTPSASSSPLAMRSVMRMMRAMPTETKARSATSP